MKSRAAEAGRAEGEGLAGEKEAVGGEGEVVEAGNCGDAGNEAFEAAAQQRFAAGEGDMTAIRLIKGFGEEFHCSGSIELTARV